MRIEHVALYVRDLEGAREFFCRYFGATAGARYHNERTSFMSYFLTFDDGARIEVMTLPTVKDDPKELNRTGYILSLIHI